MKPTAPPIPTIVPLLVGMLAISFAPILVRFSDAPVSIQGMYRMLFTFLLMLPFAVKSMPAVRRLTLKDWWLLFWAGFFLALHFILWMASLSYTSIASSTILLSLEPVFVMVGTFLIFKDRASRLAIIGMVIALAGAIIVGSGDMSVSREAVFGDLLSFLGTVAVAVNMLIAKQILTRVPAFLYSLIVFFFTFLCFLAYNLAMGIELTGYPRKEWIVFLLLAVIPTVFGHLVFNWLMQYVKATTISMSVLAEPIGASLLGMLIFGEMVTGMQLFGGAFIIYGLFLYLRAERADTGSAAKMELAAAPDLAPSGPPPLSKEG
ncbi:DMT family transporter [Paenibacillus methanolicus]|uniref:Drug/metabolite transporter (DMT)-like permease n=1 Tax=Paenibacillus methanolicus TaxID=582686 RepID=A0A5S5BUZ0_9BACL|nr:DMT family transporter [Paenibacillus methanolicus]TYP70809.1 drug/metabolite transporter (DMT)-like permease [Paenibacillus methanolicus]